MSNPRYIPPNANRQSNSQPGKRPMQFAAPPNGQHRYNEQSNNNFDINNQYEMPIQSQQNDNRGFNYPPPPSQTIQKRVQIVDHNRQSPPSEHMSEGESQNSHLLDYNQKQPIFKPRPEDHKSDSTMSNGKRPNNLKIHDYLYGLAAPDPGLLKSKIEKKISILFF